MHTRKLSHMHPTPPRPTLTIETPELIGSQEACRILGISVATLTRRVHAGQINAAGKMPGRNGALVYWRTDIEKLAGEAQPQQ